MFLFHTCNGGAVQNGIWIILITYSCCSKNFTDINYIKNIQIRVTNAPINARSQITS